jgi:hypothetical protein
VRCTWMWRWRGRKAGGREPRESHGYDERTLSKYMPHPASTLRQEIRCCMMWLQDLKQVGLDAPTAPQLPIDAQRNGARLRRLVQDMAMGQLFACKMNATLAQTTGKSTKSCEDSTYCLDRAVFVQVERGVRFMAVA